MNIIGAYKSKKCISISVYPSVYENLERIAYVNITNLSNIIYQLMNLLRLILIKLKIYKA